MEIALVIIGVVVGLVVLQRLGYLPGGSKTRANYTASTPDQETDILYGERGITRQKAGSAEISDTEKAE